MKQSNFIYCLVLYPIAVILLFYYSSGYLSTNSNLFTTYPQQIHLSFGHNKKHSTSVFLTFSVKKKTTCTLEVDDETAIYNKDLVPKELKKDFNSNYIYKFEIKNLKYNAKYKYGIQCGSKEDVYRFSRSFFTNPGLKDNVNLLVLGDWSTAPVGDPGKIQHTQFPKPNVLGALQEESNFTSIWHLGDIAYDLQSESGLRGDNYLNEIEIVTDHVPYMLVPGNHETSDSYKQYRARFNMPGPAQSNGLYYSYDIGRAHVVVINTEFRNNYKKEKELEFNKSMFYKQLNWLKKDLEKHKQNREARPWLVVMGHKPMYCSTNKHSYMIQRVCELQAPNIRETYEDLFLDYKVDLFFFGHLHLYERSYPIGKNYKVYKEESEFYRKPKGPIHVINGVAGNIESKHVPFNVTDTPLKSTYMISEPLGYGILSIVNKTHLNYKQIAFGESQFDPADSDLWPTRRVIDDFWIIK